MKYVNPIYILIYIANVFYAIGNHGTFFDEGSHATSAVVLIQMTWSMHAPGQSWTQKISDPNVNIANLCMI